MEKGPKTIPRIFSLTPAVDKMLLEIVEKRGSLSRSEAIRAIITETHTKTFKDYVYSRSASEIEKRKKMATDEQVSAMTDAEYAEEYIGGGLLVKDGDGNDFYIIHGYANIPTPIPLSTIRELEKTDPGLLDVHKTRSATTTIKSQLSVYMVQYLKRYYNIDLPVFKPEDEENKSDE